MNYFTNVVIKLCQVRLSVRWNLIDETNDVGYNACLPISTHPLNLLDPRFFEKKEKQPNKWNRKLKSTTSW